MNHLGEEFVGSAELGLAAKVLQNLFNPEPSCRTPKVPQNSGERLGARTCLFEDRLLFLPTLTPPSLHWVRATSEPFQKTISTPSNKSWFLGRGWGQQLFNFRSPAVQWMARTFSLNCLSCRNPDQTPHSLNCLPPFHWKPFFFSLTSASSHPLPKNRLWSNLG